MNILVPVAVSFITLLSFIWLLFIAYRGMQNPDRASIQKRLSTLISSEYENIPLDITRKTLFSDIPFLNKVLLHVPGIQRIDTLLQQANLQIRVASFLGISLFLALSGYLVIYSVTTSYLLSLAALSFFALAPFFYLVFKKGRRIRKFERQLPDALDLIARSLKAGHAFSEGIRLAADEFEDPLKTEFRRTIQEINFGVGVPDALKGLARRVDCPDLKFFVVSVILQRETGGNLAEIIENIAHVIRERFKLRDKIRTLSAEARLSANILAVFPFLIILAIHFTNPDYIGVLFTNPLGRKMAGIAILMMVLGIFIMNRMVRIKI